MGRETLFPHLHGIAAPAFHDESQQELFSSENLLGSGCPLRIEIPDPNQKGRTRTMVVASGKMMALLANLEQAAPTDGTVLLVGESGSGKNWLAWLLHFLSDRRDGPFVEFCANHYPEGLVDSVLFGHEKGAYTGAWEAKPGKLELAENGTLFIPEAGDLPLSSQLKLHRVLDDRVFEKVGGTKSHPSNVRIIAATHRDLLSLIREGKFREDLYFRLNVVYLTVPPLRERIEEIPAIAESMLRELSERHRKPWLRWASGMLELLASCPWPGNLRVLRNTIERMVVLAQGELLGKQDIPSAILGETVERVAPTAVPFPGLEKKLRFIQAYKMFHGNRSAIAKHLETSRNEVRRKIRLYGLEEGGGGPNGVDQGWTKGGP